MYDGLLRIKLPNGSSLVGFADDLALLVVAEKAWLVEIIANEALELIAEWLTSRLFQLTVRKCEAILVITDATYAQLRRTMAGTQTIAGNSGRVDSAVWGTYLGRLHSCIFSG